MDRPDTFGFGLDEDFGAAAAVPTSVKGTFFVSNFRVMFLAYDDVLPYSSPSMRRAVGLVNLPHMAVGQISVSGLTIVIKTKTYRTLSVKFEQRDSTWAGNQKAILDRIVFPKFSSDSCGSLFAFAPAHRTGVHEALGIAPALYGGTGTAGAAGTASTDANAGSSPKAGAGIDGWDLFDPEREAIRQGLLQTDCADNRRYSQTMWRLYPSDPSEAHRLSPTYPSAFVVPADMDNRVGRRLMLSFATNNPAFVNLLVVDVDEPRIHARNPCGGSLPCSLEFTPSSASCSSRFCSRLCAQCAPMRPIKGY